MVFVVNQQTSRSPQVMGLVRVFVLHCLKINTLFFIRHIQGLDNGIADTLSRFLGGAFPAAGSRGAAGSRPDASLA